ncbi:uncharacterized protein VDAG_07795 [Verticillium dahliae VdLs.17]|uniref:Uncharacterized protein n=1 Tax=Verticillium dahliae (strain VdLs.17 / ATCC MYA-4575 / FGSC 10137) TaxID=498257 RepID=G2XCB3_VERDV|nr:uncharacterized protein VDAG_07795 [Verticillium dahliae VdLs.17]EGY16631.1 hypothetical protein VDAG_07795 [Verticillium dahliae VdLs.17]
MTKDENGRGSPGGSLPRALMTLPKSPGCSSCRSPDQRHGRRLWAHAAGAPRTELDGGHWFSRFENQREMDRLVALEDNRSHYGRHENVAWRPPGPTKYAFSVQDTVARGLGRDGDDTMSTRKRKQEEEEELVSLPEDDDGEEEEEVPTTKPEAVKGPRRRKRRRRRMTKIPRAKRTSPKQRTALMTDAVEKDEDAEEEEEEGDAEDEEADADDALNGIKEAAADVPDKTVKATDAAPEANGDAKAVAADGDDKE